MGLAKSFFMPANQRKSTNIAVLQVYIFIRIKVAKFT